MEETMARLGRVLSAAVIVGAGAALVPGSAHGQSPSSPAPVTQVARVSPGTITGIVSDEQGRPVAGARVTAIGVTMALAFTDKAGRFVTERLPAGEYVVRAHRSGFAASRREIVLVGNAATSVPQLQIRRLDGATGTAGPAGTPVPSRPIVAAGFSLPAAEPAAEGSDAPKDSHPHSETAWRLRHIKRSILKDRANGIVLADSESDLSDESIFGRAVGGAADGAGYATPLFTDLPFSGEVNLLTTSVFGPGELLDGPRRNE
jgi:hypothetical protein